ncbi:MAG: hypothetical protein U0354_07295 [Candidatus Sericytochromatia bacterium]
MINKEELEEKIDKLYSLDNLIKIYRDFLSDFGLESQEIKLDQKDVVFSKQKAQKKELVNILTELFYNQDIFNKLLEKLPKDVKKVFELIVWEGGKHRTDILEKELDITIIMTNSSNVQYISSNYLFFLTEKISNFNQQGFQYKLFLPDEIRELIKESFKTPKGYEIQPTEEIEDTDYINQDSSSIIRKIQLYFNYLNTGNIFYSKNSKPSKVSIKNMHDYCEIKEFFNIDNKDLTYLKTEMIIDILKEVNVSSVFKPIDSIREVLKKFQSNDFNFYPDTLLEHLRGKGDLSDNHDYKERAIKIRRSCLDLIKELPQSKWVDLETLTKFVFYRDLFFKPFDEKFAEDNIYFDESKKASNSYTYSQKTFIKDDLYKIVITTPLIKSIMFLFSSIGLVDIAYNNPINGEYRQKNEDYLTPYDSLKYVRVSELGYSILHDENFNDFEIEEDISDITFTTDEDRLLISVYGYDKIKMLFLESLAEKLSDDKFKVTFSSFINGCNTLEDIENRIKTFKSEISNTLTPIWADFFNKVIENASSLRLEDNIEVFKIKNNRIIDVITNDILLKNYIYKVEDYRIAIKSENIPSVKKRLAEFGFLFEFSI